jgi:transcriptional regulator with XRE-family HTH domain
MSYSKKLIQIRSKKNWSQEKLASHLNVSFATVNRWENEKSEPQREARESIDVLWGSLQEENYPALNQVLAHSKRSKLTILLDENLFQLKPALKDSGFKVILMKKGTSDEEIRELAEGTAILTTNSKDFIPHAVADDFDVISAELIKFIDTEPTRKNQTVQKIAKAIRESGMVFTRGNFNLVVRDDGSYELKPLV